MDIIDATLAANFAAPPDVKDLYYLPGVNSRAGQRTESARQDEAKQ
jgi:hypothetical protein